MDAIVLAAGRGSRMGRLTEALPKCMTRLAGQPLLSWQLSSLHKGGARRLGIVTGYKPEAFDPFCGGSVPIHRFVNERWAETNMVASLAMAANWLQTTTCIVSYSDIFYSPDTITQLADAPGDIAISFDPNWLALWSARFEDPLGDAETFRRDAQGRIVEIGARAQSLQEIEGQYMGLLKFTPAGWTRVTEFLARQPKAQRDTMSMTGLLQNLLKTGVEIHAIPCVGAWGEIDNENDLRVFESMLRENRLQLDWADPAFAVSGPIADAA